jgi:hypothetical protein
MLSLSLLKMEPSRLPENAKPLEGFSPVPAAAPETKLAATAPLVLKNSLRPLFMLACTPYKVG